MMSASMVPMVCEGGSRSAGMRASRDMASAIWGAASLMVSGRRHFQVTGDVGIVDN